MSLIIFVPVILLVVGLILFFSRGRKASGDGMGNRNDENEPVELRGEEQRKHREQR